MTTLPERNQRLVAGLDLARDRGFEVGPLDTPIVPKDGADVLYLDHASTEDLRTKYDGDENVGDIAPVDVVWGSAHLGTALAEVLERRGPFRYAVASHVIEHVPDMIGWLQQIAEVLEPGGTLRLAIPDKRYCFDFHRPLTEVAELVAAHIEGRTRPPAAAIFDFWSRLTVADAPRLWNGDGPPVAAGQDGLGLSKAREASAVVDYFDVHCWVFTPSSFLDALHRLAELDLLPFAVQSVVPTRRDDVEFFVVLERLPDGVLPEERRELQRAAVAEARAGVEAAEPADETEPDGFRLSPRERQLIERKRRLLTALRARFRR
jgi:hypothetical protein